MKRLILFLTLTIISLSAFAQFPLGSKLKDIKAYFNQNIAYASVQKFKTQDGVNAVCFTKVRVLGDYTFYFDKAGNCTSYVVTYDQRELKEVSTRFDIEFSRTQQTKWEDPDKTYDITLLPAKSGENYFSIVYEPKAA